MNKRIRYPAEVKERAVRMVFEHQSEHSSQWATINSIAEHGKAGNSDAGTVHKRGLQT